MFRIALALLFILRLRFPADKSLFEVTRERYGVDGVRTLRRLESVSRRREKAALDLDFLKRCLDGEIFPKFLRIKLYRENLTRTSMYKEFQLKLLENEINSKKQAIIHWDKVVTSIKNDLRRVVSVLDYIHFSSFVDRSVDSLRKNVTVTQKKKYVALL